MHFKSRHFFRNTVVGWVLKKQGLIAEIRICMLKRGVCVLLPIVNTHYYKKIKNVHDEIIITVHDQ